MREFLYLKQVKGFCKISRTVFAVTLMINLVVPPSFAQLLPGLPQPGEAIWLTSTYEPPVLKGLTVHPENPLYFDFILDRGQDQLSNSVIKDESARLIKYFLASITIPDQDAWVNLSPYEKDRIIPDALGQTEMGRQMLQQDYLLKQLASSLTNPDKELGQKFWTEVKTRAQKQFGSLEVPLSTFNKVWIVPEAASVVEKDGTVYITDSKLTVMLEEDYQALRSSVNSQDKSLQNLSSDVFRQMILPQLVQEVNEGKNFAPTRQVFQSVILATWYKKALKDSLLGRVYADQKKIAGIETDEKNIKQKVYEQYLAAFKTGVYNTVKEENSIGGELIPRKYFSGGENFVGFSPKVGSSAIDYQKANSGFEDLGRTGRIIKVQAGVEEPPAVRAIVSASSGLPGELNQKIVALNLESKGRWQSVAFDRYQYAWKTYSKPAGRGVVTVLRQYENEENVVAYAILDGALDFSGKTEEEISAVLKNGQLASTIYVKGVQVVANVSKNIEVLDITNSGQASVRSLSDSDKEVLKGVGDFQVEGADLVNFFGVFVAKDIFREVGDRSIIEFVKFLVKELKDYNSKINFIVVDQKLPQKFITFDAGTGVVSIPGLVNGVGANEDFFNNGLVGLSIVVVKASSVIISAEELRGFISVQLAESTPFSGGDKVSAILNILMQQINSQNSNITGLTKEAALAYVLKNVFERSPSSWPAVQTPEDLMVLVTDERFRAEVELEIISMLGNTKKASVPLTENKNVGGINFDPRLLNLQIKRDGRGVPLPVLQQDLQHINIQGLSPVIINIQPINANALPLFSELQNKEKALAQSPT